MELPMNRFQPLLVDVRMGTGQVEISALPEHLLDDPEIGSRCSEDASRDCRRSRCG